MCWADAEGMHQQRLIDVAGGPNPGADVDPETCAPRGAGHDSLCAVWSDPSFDPAQSAHY